MSQQIHCRDCKVDTETQSMASLIARHTDPKGRLCCATCGGTDTFLQAHDSGSGSDDKTWIKGVIPIDTKFADAACVPFVFLIADAADGDVTGIAFKYYRASPSNGGRAKAKRRSHGGPVLAQSQLLALVARLVSAGVVSGRDWRLLRNSTENAS